MAAAAGGKSTVRLSGIVLSSLMFEHLNSDSDVEGLILGESISEEQVTINDTQVDQIDIEEIFNVKRHIACPTLQGFCSSTGEVDMKALQRLLGDTDHRSVIGWYKQRRNTDQQMTWRERTVHDHLRKTLSNPHFVFFLLTSSCSVESGSTQKTEFAAYVQSHRHVTKVPVSVHNLGSFDPVSYCRSAALCSTDGYDLVFRKHRSKFFSSSGCLNDVEEINRVNESLQSELYNMCRDVVTSERQRDALQLEVAALRRKVQERKHKLLLEEPRKPVPEPQRNLLLHEAVKALFGQSLLFQSQTLTTAAFPILDLCCSLQDQQNQEEEEEEEEPVSRKVSLKRPTATIPGNDQKRKKI